MKRWIAGALCALLIVGLAAGCQPDNSSSEESVSSSAVSRRPDNLPPEETVTERASAPTESAAPASAPEDAPAEAPRGKQLIVYLYRPEENNYFPSVEPVGDGAGIGDILDVVTHVLELPAAYETGTQETDKGIVLDFSGEYIDTCLTDSELETIFLNTLCATLAANREGKQGGVELRRDGGAYRSAGRTLQAGSLYEWPPVTIGGGTAAEYTALRATIPYDGLNELTTTFLRYNIVPTDAVGEELTRLLARIGDPGKEIATPADLGSDYIQARALENVIWYTTVDYGQAEVYTPELLPITAAVEDQNVALGEHVTEAARELFGIVPFENGQLSPWKWHPTEGVYTPPNVGGGDFVQPVILSCEDRGDNYRIELVYLKNVTGVFVDEHGAAIPAENLKTVAETSMRRREVVVGKTFDGELVFHSHHYL